VRHGAGPARRVQPEPGLSRLLLLLVTRAGITRDRLRLPNAGRVANPPRGHRRTHSPTSPIGGRPGALTRNLPTDSALQVKGRDTRPCVPCPLHGARRGYDLPSLWHGPTARNLASGRSGRSTTGTPKSPLPFAYGRRRCGVLQPFAGSGEGSGGREPSRSSRPRSVISEPGPSVFSHLRSPLALNAYRPQRSSGQS
jgi:hypothetical protein